jgi:hypothetical protein
VGRVQRRPDPSAGPVAWFAYELQLLREKAGSPDYRSMAAQAHCAASTLSTAAAGRRVPTWETTRAFIRVCGGDEAEWRSRWEAVAGEVSQRVSPPDPSRASPRAVPFDQPPGRQDADQQPGSGPGSTRRVWPRATAGIAVLTLAAAVIAAAATRSGSAPHPSSTPRPETSFTARDGQDPYVAGCGPDKQILEERPMVWPNGRPYGTLALFYSERCHAIWGFVYGPNSTQWDVHIAAHRHSDGATAASDFQGQQLPNSWGNVLTTVTGCVYVTGYLTERSIRSHLAQAQTGCWQSQGPVTHSPIVTHAG